jgi:hypothetical protein
MGREVELRTPRLLLRAFRAALKFRRALSYNGAMEFETGYFESEPWCTQEEFARFIESHENDRTRYELLNGRIVGRTVR